MKRQIVITGWQSKVLTALYEEDTLCELNLEPKEKPGKSRRYLYRESETYCTEYSGSLCGDYTGGDGILSPEG